MRVMYEKIKFKIACERYMMGMRFDKWFRSVYSEELFRYLTYRSMLLVTLGFWMVVFNLRSFSEIGLVLLGMGVILFLLVVEMYAKHEQLEEEYRRLSYVLEESGLINYRGEDLD